MMFDVAVSVFVCVSFRIPQRFGCVVSHHNEDAKHEIYSMFWVRRKLEPQTGDIWMCVCVRSGRH